MELKQLQYFMQICESGSILKAANELFMTQQAVSKSIASLERELGAPLFFRTAKGVVLTQMGQEFRKNCKPVMESLERLNDNMKEALRLNSGRLRIGICGGFMYLGSNKIWSDFQNLYPNIRVERREYGYKEGIKLLRSGEIDAAIISDPEQIEQIDDFLLFHLPSASRSLVVSKSGPLSQLEFAEIKDLKDEKFILCINDFAYYEFIRLCRQNGFTPDIQRTSDTIYMCELCNTDGMTGIIISFIADRVLDHYSNVRLVPFKEPILEYSLVMLARRSFHGGRILKELADYLSYVLQGNM